MIKKLRFKIVAIVLAITLLLLAAMSVAILWNTQQSLENESISMMQSVAMEPMATRRLEPGQHAYFSVPYFVIQQAFNGDIIITNGYYDLSDDDFLESVTDMLWDNTLSDGDTGLLTDYNLRYYRFSTFGKIGMVFADFSAEKTTITHLIRILLLIDLFSLAMFTFLAWILARWITRPIDNAWKQQKQFVSDASHELKTPLTVILTNAELLQDNSYSEADHSRFAVNILTMAGQMRGLVESLLELARVDNGAVQNNFESLNLSELVSDAVLPYEPLCFEKGLVLNSEIEEGIVIRGSRQHLVQTVGVLLDNAQKYSDGPGSINLTLKHYGKGKCRLSVSNHGEEIPQEHLSKIFERFYREDSARSMNHSYGLGLAIAENIVRDHGGKIWAESKDGINTFLIDLPTE